MEITLTHSGPIPFDDYPDGSLFICRMCIEKTHFTGRISPAPVRFIGSIEKNKRRALKESNSEILGHLIGCLGMDSKN